VSFFKRGVAVMLAALAASGASPDEAAAREPAFVERAVSFDAGELVLSGVLFEPLAPASERRPAVVLLHGCGGMADARGALYPRHRDWAGRFARWGLIVLVVDSFGPRGLGSLCELKDRPLSPWRQRTADAYASLDYLVARDDVDPAMVFVLGWSHGGSTVLGVVRPQARDSAAARPRFRAAIAFYPACAAALGLADYRPTMPLLILHGAADDWSPPAPCAALARRSRGDAFPARTVVYPDAHHGFDEPGRSVRRLPGVYNPRATNERGAHFGTHEPSRLAAIGEIRAFLGSQLGRLPDESDRGTGRLQTTPRLRSPAIACASYPSSPSTACVSSPRSGGGRWMRQGSSVNLIGKPSTSSGP
jgi:dienelactone hydrolase